MQRRVPVVPAAIAALVAAGVVVSRGCGAPAPDVSPPSPRTRSSDPAPTPRALLPPPASRGPVPGPEAKAAEPLPVPIAVLRGRVVDGVTRRPVPRATLRWGFLDDAAPELRSAVRGESGEDGSFELRRMPWEAPRDDGDVDELRAATDDHLVAGLRQPTSPAEVVLWPAGSPAPGRLDLRVLRGDGAPWTGLVLVQAMDDLGRGEELCAVADGEGRATLHAVPRRVRRVRVGDRAPWTEIDVVSGGVAHFELRGPAPTRFAAASWADVRAARDAAAVRMRGDDAAKAAEAEATWREAWDELNRRLPSQRPLVVTGLPPDTEPIVEVRVGMKGGWDRVWRLPRHDGSVTLVTPRDDPHWWRIRVTRGDGGVRSRTITFVGIRDSGVQATTGPGARTPVELAVREDDTVVVPWDALADDAESADEAK